MWNGFCSVNEWEEDREHVKGQKQILSISTCSEIEEKNIFGWKLIDRTSLVVRLCESLKISSNHFLFRFGLELQIHRLGRNRVLEKDILMGFVGFLRSFSLLLLSASRPSNLLLKCSYIDCIGFLSMLLATRAQESEIRICVHSLRRENPAVQTVMFYSFDGSDINFGISASTPIQPNCSVPRRDDAYLCM